MKLKICETTENKMFEIVVQIRDAEGNPTGRTKSYSTDNPDKLAQFWNNMRGRPKRKKKKKTNHDKLPKGKDADKLAQTIGEETEKKKDGIQDIIPSL
jgi:hypothetical protein